MRRIDIGKGFWGVGWFYVEVLLEKRPIFWVNWLFFDRFEAFSGIWTKTREEFQSCVAPFPAPNPHRSYRLHFNRGVVCLICAQEASRRVYVTEKWKCQENSFELQVLMSYRQSARIQPIPTESSVSGINIHNIPPTRGKPRHLSLWSVYILVRFVFLKSRKKCAKKENPISKAFGRHGNHYRIVSNDCVCVTSGRSRTHKSVFYLLDECVRVYKRRYLRTFVRRFHVWFRCYFVLQNIEEMELDRQMMNSVEYIIYCL